MRHAERRGGLRVILGLACLSAFSIFALLAGDVLPASAATAMRRPLLEPPPGGTFDGSDTTAGKFKFEYSDLEGVAVDESSGSVYVLDYINSKPFLDRFNAVGEAQNFPLTGESSLPLSRPTVEGEGVNNSIYGIAVDGSGANPGRIYVAYTKTVRALSATGQFLPGELEVPGPICNIAIDAEGHPWISDKLQPVVREYANTGWPPVPIGEVEDSSGTEEPCAIALGKEGELYIGQSGNGGSVDKYVGGVFDSVLDPFSSQSIAIDQRDTGEGHVFVGHDGNYSEYGANGALIANYGEGVNGEATIGGGASHIAYNPALDQVYVQKGPDKKVFIFGKPEALGPVPDVTISPTTSGSIETAHICGTINPLGLENSYHLEYKANGAAAWISGVIKLPTEHIAPSDSITHEVCADLTGLEPFVQYQARLVASNDVTGFESISKVDLFRTGKAAKATINAPSEVTAHSADVSGTVDPGDTEATWRFQTSVHPNCLAGLGFSDRTSQVIPANAGLTLVDEELTGLTPNQDYCVRLTATNGPGTVNSEIKAFKTDPVQPVVELRGAAPRTQTGVRLNAFLDSGNAATSYRFEYSGDGGASWIPLADHVLAAGTSAALVSEEVSGLKSATIYSFRVFAESVGGIAVGDEAQSFETLAPPPTSCANEDVRQKQHTDGYLGACRGIELVSNPDKGNQTASAVGDEATPPMTADGNKVLWSVLGGAPGAPNGTKSNFLAKRSASGWSSQSIAPKAEEQVGKGDFVYHLTAVTPDFSTAVFSALLSSPFAPPQLPTVVRMREGKQDILKSYVGAVPNAGYENSVDLSDDGEHVLFMNLQTKQLEDIGTARIGPPETSGELISSMPGGSPSECGLDLTAGNSFPGIQGSANVGHPDDHWIATADASRVYFAAQADGVCSGRYGLYVRAREAPKTTLIDPGALGGSPEPIRVTPDGKRAYFATFSSCRKFAYPSLSCETPETADTDDSADVYLWDENAGAEGESSCLTCVADGPAHLAVFGGGLGGVLASADFSHIYFTSRERLVPGQGTQGALNLYALTGGQIHFVAVTDGDSLFRGEPAISADGNVLLFATQATPQLSTDAMAAKCVSPRGALGACEERYLYDDRDGSIECISCRHNGVTTHSAGSPGGGESFELSSDGSTAAFATPEALAPEDVNNDTDIYEWRNGAVGLITDGVTDFQEEFSAPRVWTVDANGSDILFGVVPPGGSLTGFERDGVSNLYDARIGGGWLPPEPQAHCNEDSCQGPLQAAPLLERPASPQSSKGNVKAGAHKKTCRKGKVRRQGRCVERHSHKGKHRRRGAGAKQGGAK